MRTLIVVALGLALYSPAMAAETMEGFRVEVMQGLLRSCLANDLHLAQPMTSKECACWAGQIAEGVTITEAVSANAGIMPESYVKRMQAAAYNCIR